MLPLFDFISPPGDTIADLLEDLSVTPAELADRLGYTLESVKLLLAGKASITGEVALKLEMLGSTAEFWLRREAIYQTELVRHGIELDCQPLVAQGVEEWRPIPGYEGLYSASTLGRVKREPGMTPGNGKDYRRRGKVLKQQTNTKGYKVVNLCKDTWYKVHLASRLIALTFIENPDNKPSVCHLDGNVSNNKVLNLAWATQKEIVDNCLASGTFTCAGKGRNCKKKPVEIATMREMVMNGISRPIVAKVAGCAVRTVRKYTKDLP